MNLKNSNFWLNSILLLTLMFILLLSSCSKKDNTGPMNPCDTLPVDSIFISDSVKAIIPLHDSLIFADTLGNERIFVAGGDRYFFQWDCNLRIEEIQQNYYCSDFPYVFEYDLKLGVTFANPEAQNISEQLSWGRIQKFGSTYDKIYPNGIYFAHYDTLTLNGRTFMDVNRFKARSITDVYLSTANEILAYIEQRDSVLWIRQN